ncbi:MAG: hypothetical protein GX851_01480 [Clostridiales bacterium]|nr:hypothetical protein [Clostridiales bacterium]
MAKAATADDVNTWLNEKWLPSLLQGKRLPEGYDISDFIVRASENANPAFTAATAGNLSTPNGTNGSYYFEVGTYYDMNGEPFFELVAESICTITAAPYVHEHAWSANWSSDNTAHWHECTICDDKKDYKKHEYGKADALGVRTCTACNYSETVSVGIHDDGGSWAATFTPTGDSRLSPGTAMKAQDYTPTARDLQVALEAIDINAEKREASAEYIVEERDIIIKDLMKIGKENYWMGDHYDQGEINGVIIHMIEQDGVKTINAVSLKNDNKWYVITDTDGSVSVRARDTSDSLIAKYELITINGVPYFISYTFTEDNITEYNIIYTTDSKLAGVLVKDNYGPVGVFNRGCDPEALKASRALCEYFTDKDGALFAIRSVFSQDLSLQKNDAPIKLTGDMQIAFKPKLPVSKDTTFVGLHRTETGYETVKAEVIDGKVIAEFSDTDQSPFMIFAVERVWQPEQSGTQNPGENPRTDADSNMALWLALMFVSAGTVVTPGIKSKRKKAVR